MRYVNPMTANSRDVDMVVCFKIIDELIDFDFSGMDELQERALPHAMNGDQMAQTFIALGNMYAGDVETCDKWVLAAGEGEGRQDWQLQFEDFQPLIQVILRYDVLKSVETEDLNALEATFALFHHLTSVTTDQNAFFYTMKAIRVVWRQYGGGEEATRFISGLLLQNADELKSNRALSTFWSAVVSALSYGTAVEIFEGANINDKDFVG